MNKNLDELFPLPRAGEDAEARELAAVIRKWADKEVIARRLDYADNYARLFAENRNKLARELGLNKLFLPEKAGGAGWHRWERAAGLLAVITEVGRADAALGVTVAIEYAVFSLWTSDPARYEAILPLFQGEEIKTAALILPGAGISGEETPLFYGRALKARLNPDGDGPRLSGQALRPLGSGLEAELLAIAAVDPEGRPGLALVAGNSAGVNRGPLLITTGLNACRNCDIGLEQVKLPPAQVIPGEEALCEVCIRLNLAAGGVSLGAALNFFEILSDWAESRTIKGGTPLKENPLCAAVLGEVAEEIALSRFNLYLLAQLMAEENCPSVRLFTLAQLVGMRVQQSALKAVNRGMELMGSAGYAKEWQAEKHWRDIKTLQSYLCGVGGEAPVKLDIARFYYNCREI